VKRSISILLIYIVVAYLFALGFREIYLWELSKIGVDISYHGSPMINTNDGYYFAEGARDILAGFHQPNDLSPIDYPLSKLTALLARITHIPLDTLIFYMPGIFGALLAVPLVLIGYELGLTFMGFLAGLIAPVVWSYYHRTMFGYYDTDMLTVVLPTFAIWGVVRSFLKNDIKTLWIAPLFLALSIWWHVGLQNIANAIFILTLLYWVVFDRKKETMFLLILMIIAIAKITILIKLPLIFILNTLFFIKKEGSLKYLPLLAGVGVVFYLFFGGYEWIEALLRNAYFHREVSQSEEGLKFYNVINTVREASHISIDTLVHRISGSYYGFILGFIGYVLLLLRYNILIVSLPMVGLGIYALWGGLRFTIFAVPFFALGDAYLAIWFLSRILNRSPKSYAYYLGGILAAAAFIYPNFLHARNYIMPPVFEKHEIELLQKFKHIAKRDDYVLTWWDYGYPIRYYADVKTLVDGGKHSGDVNFPVSFALSTSSQRASYNMAFLDVYFTEEFYKKGVKNKTYIEAMMERYGIKDPQNFLKFLEKKVPLPKVSNDIYYYLPLRMIDIFPTVILFSQIDLKSGNVDERHFFFRAPRIRKVGNRLDLGAGVSIALDRGTVIVGNKEFPLERFTTVLFGKDGKSTIKDQIVDPSANLNAINLPQFGKLLIVDDFFYNSTYFQMYLFDNYDHKLFEPVISDPLVKIYRLKK